VKPKQVYWGGPIPKSSKVTAIDAVGCRTNAIVDSVDPLPVFCPLDAPELCHDQNNALRRDPMYYDYIYVDVPDGDRRDRFPYTGRRFYWKGSVRYMLDTGKIDKGHLKAGVRATNHVSPSTLNDAFKTIKEVYVHVIHLKKCWECIAPDEISPKEMVRCQKALSWHASASGTAPNSASGERSSPPTRATREAPCRGARSWTTASSSLPGASTW
jgi:hypothetical protein